MTASEAHTASVERGEVADIVDGLLAHGRVGGKQLLPGAGVPFDVGFGATTRPDGEYVLAILLEEGTGRLLELAADLVRRVGGQARTMVIGPVVPEKSVPVQLAPGDSIGPVDGSVTGTLGCFVRTTDRSLALLSNAHVLTPRVDGVVGGTVVCPGLADGAGEPVATVTAALPLRPGVVRPIDAAAARVHANVAPDEHALGLRPAPLAADVGMPVVKVGRTTGQTQGDVEVVDAAVALRYVTGRVWLRDLIGVDGRTTRFTAPGDSGAIVLGADDGLAYGLHVAGTGNGGTSGHGISFAQALPLVLAALGATLAGTPDGHA